AVRHLLLHHRRLDERAAAPARLLPRPGADDLRYDGPAPPRRRHRPRRRRGDRRGGGALASVRDAPGTRLAARRCTPGARYFRSMAAVQAAMRSLRRAISATMDAGLTETTTRFAAERTPGGTG